MLAESLHTHLRASRATLTQRFHTIVNQTIARAGERHISITATWEAQVQAFALEAPLQMETTGWRRAVKVQWMDGTVGCVRARRAQRMRRRRTRQMHPQMRLRTRRRRQTASDMPIS